MRDWQRVATLLAVVGVSTLAALLAVGGAGQPSAAGSIEARAVYIAAELRCPTCQGLSVADSPSQTATEIRRQIQALLADGASDDEVKEHFVARYGDWILLSPRQLIAWLLPPLVVIAGALVLVRWFRRRPLIQQPTPKRVADALRERARREAEVLDA